MDGKGFFLGLIAAVVLFLLWKKEQGHVYFGGANPPSLPSSLPATQGGCAGCGSPSSAAAPASQAVLMGPDGQITPGTPPLNAATAAGSFYAPSGPTPDTGFFSYPAKFIPIFAPVERAASANVPSSPTTVATQVPVRATQVVPNYSGLGGFQQRYNLLGVPRIAAENMLPN